MKKLPHVFRRRKLLLIFLIASMVFSLAKLSVPVSASPSPETRVYVEMPPEGYINGTEIGVNETFTVDVYIENATDLNQWALSVEVDPNVLNVSGAEDDAGTVIYDYVEWCHDNWITTVGEVFYVDSVNHAEGTIINATHAITSWPNLYTEKGLLPEPPGGFNGSGKLCTLNFTVLDETAYSPIHLYDVLLFDGLYWETGDSHYFPPDIVEDGHYNEPSEFCGVDITDIATSHCGTPVDFGYRSWDSDAPIVVNVTVHNNGSVSGDYTVGVYYQNDATWVQIGTPQAITGLDPCNTTSRTFNWDLSGLTEHTTYTLKANVTTNCDASGADTTTFFVRYDGNVDGNTKTNVMDMLSLKILITVQDTCAEAPQGDVDGNNKVNVMDMLSLKIIIVQGGRP